MARRASCLTVHSAIQMSISSWRARRAALPRYAESFAIPGRPIAAQRPSHSASSPTLTATHRSSPWHG